MTSLLYTSVFLVGCLINIVCLEESNDQALPNEPLFLTPYLERGDIKEAQQKSRVHPNIRGVRSFTGFFTVDKECGNHLFFWFVPAKLNWEEAPVLLWLSGGPGLSSLLGLFVEIGPFLYRKETKRLVKNKYRWTKDFNVIFLDQPVGTGFSFTEKGCYMKNMTSLAQEVYSAVEQFFILFPNLQKNNFFLVGDSYAGTYQPAVGVEIDNKNRQGKVKINLKGLFVGNPFIDLKCHDYASYWFEAGIVEDYRRDTILKYQEIRNQYIKERNSTGANEYEDKIWFDEFYKTNLPDPFNIRNDKKFTLDHGHFVNQSRIRHQIHVGTIHYNATSYFGITRNALSSEKIVSSTDNLKTLLDKEYMVGFYVGQLDLVCSYSSLACALNQLNCPAYEKAKRRGWYVNGRLAGWLRRGGNLFSVVVWDAGHMVPVDQSEAALALVKGVIGAYPGTNLNFTEEEPP